MTKLKGIIEFHTFAPDTKSECKKPYICLSNGSKILVYKTEDNPFENNAFQKFENLPVSIQGELIDGVFVVTSIEEQITENKTPTEEN